jgi:AcrR family transcriptional regulator
MQASRQPSPRDQIIATALSEITAHGLTVGLDHLSLEKVIAASGVSRATAYRIWPSKQQFLADVIVASVRSTTLDVDSEQEVGRVQALLDQHPDFATDAAVRRHVVVDGLRISVQADLERIVNSPQWSTYLALSATSRGLPDGVLKTEVTSALAQADQRFTDHRISVYARLPRLLGYRLRPPLDEQTGLSLLSQAAGALMTGFVVKIGTQPHLLTDTFVLPAFGAGELAWTVPAFALTSLVLSYLEPDPDATWGPDQIARSRETLAEITDVLTRAWGEASS